MLLQRKGGVDTASLQKGQFATANGRIYLASNGNNRHSASLRPEAASPAICYAVPEFRLMRKAQKAKPAGTTKPIHDTNIGTTYSST